MFPREHIVNMQLKMEEQSQSIGPFILVHKRTIHSSKAMISNFVQPNQPVRLLGLYAQQCPYGCLSNMLYARPTQGNLKEPHLRPDYFS